MQYFSKFFPQISIVIIKTLWISYKNFTTIIFIAILIIHVKFYEYFDYKKHLAAFLQFSKFLQIITKTPKHFLKIFSRHAIKFVLKILIHSQSSHLSLWFSYIHWFQEKVIFFIPRNFSKRNKKPLADVSRSPWIAGVILRWHQRTLHCE